MDLSETKYRELIIIGAIGNCLDIAEAALAAHRSGGPKPIGFLDDAEGLANTQIMGLPVLGGTGDIDKFPEAGFVCGIGSPTSFRAKPALIGRFGLELARYCTVIHPSAVVSGSAAIGRGSVILSHCSIGAGVQIGEHVMMLQNCVVGHDSQVGPYSTMAAGVIVSGSVGIGPNCYLGAGSCVRNGIKIGEKTLVGMGSVVVKSLAHDGVYAGNPATAR